MPTVDEQFRFVPFGSRAPGESVACDGLVDGAATHLSHWAGNRTPAAFKADTSVEIALRFVDQGGARDHAASIITNNHFDTDGVLAVWTLLHPDAAQRHRALIIDAANAGDFDEYPDDPRGLWVDAAVNTLGGRAGDDAAAYRCLLPALADLLAHIEARDELWSARRDALAHAEAQVRAGSLAYAVHERIAVFHHRPGTRELPGPVLSRLAGRDVTRWLLAFEERDGTFRYRYERPRWAWADTVTRPTIPAPSRNAIARGLSLEDWALKGSLGMTGLLRTTHPIATDPHEVARTLAANDPGARVPTAR